MSEACMYYPMTVAQNLLFLNQKFTLHKQVNNIFTLMLVEEKLDLDVLRKAICLAYEHNDSLRIRLKKTDGAIRQYFTPPEQLEIPTLDFTGRTRESMDEELYRLAKKPIRILNSRMCRFFLVRSTDGSTGVYFGVNHIVLDSWGICVHVKYIMDLYEALKSGGPMPKRLFPYEKLLAGDVKYKETPQYQKDLDFWRQECLRDEPWFTHVNGPGVQENYRRKKHADRLRCGSCFTLRTVGLHETITIPAEQVYRMETWCRERGLPVQTLFMLAVRTCLSKRNNRQKDVTFYSPVAMRATLQRRYSGGSQVHTVIFRTVLEESCTFHAALEQIQERQNLLYRHAESDMVEIMKLFSDTYCKGDPMASYASVCLTFQPVPLTLNGGRKCRTIWYCNGASSQPFYLTIMDDDGSGGLRCYYEYQKSTVLRQTVLNFHENMVKIILAGIENENMTVGELLDL